MTPPPRPAPELGSAPPLETVVGIGASAGGIEALCELLSAFRYDGSAFVIVMHLSPSHRSQLATVLRPCTHMAVVRAERDTALERNTVYVMPEGVDIVLSQPSRMSLVPPHEPRPRRTIDHFFRSLAVHRGHQGVGIILSGMGSDGTSGLEAIRDKGGSTYVQTPTSAAFAQMPSSAMKYANHVGKPREIGLALMERLGASRT